MFRRLWLVCFSVSFVFSSETFAVVDFSPQNRVPFRGADISKCRVLLSMEENGVVNKDVGTVVSQSKKIIDFVSGAAYGLDGTSQQIGCKVFLFAPSGVEVTPDGKTTFSLPSEKILRSYRDFRD